MLPFLILIVGIIIGSTVQYVHDTGYTETKIAIFSIIMTFIGLGLCVLQYLKDIGFTF